MAKTLEKCSRNIQKENISAVQAFMKESKTDKEPPGYWKYCKNSNEPRMSYFVYVEACHNHYDKTPMLEKPKRGKTKGV